MKGYLTGMLSKESRDRGYSLVEDEDFIYLYFNDKIKSVYSTHGASIEQIEQIEQDITEFEQSKELVGDNSLELKAEAYMEQITYGHVSEEDATNNGRFIVSACNACKSINPEHPELVAQSLKEMYETLKNVHKQLSTGWIANDCAAADRMRGKLEFGIKQILNQAEGK